LGGVFLMQVLHLLYEIQLNGHFVIRSFRITYLNSRDFYFCAHKVIDI
jgi:hypothetical protein